MPAMAPVPNLAVGAAVGGVEAVAFVRGVGRPVWAAVGTALDEHTVAPDTLAVAHAKHAANPRMVAMALYVPTGHKEQHPVANDPPAQEL